jgi:glyceraldehyde-3-phosphate dehydrogenase/erythrose-4-phosphate dehydrogenase
LLGEIHANVAMRYLFNKADVFATGNIRDLKGQEIPIDLVVENTGFQIKNYRIENGETLFRYGGQAGNFIENRVRPE